MSVCPQSVQYAAPPHMSSMCRTPQPGQAGPPPSRAQAGTGPRHNATQRKTRRSRSAPLSSLLRLHARRILTVVLAPVLVTAFGRAGLLAEPLELPASVYPESAPAYDAFPVVVAHAGTPTPYAPARTLLVRPLPARRVMRYTRPAGSQMSSGRPFRSLTPNTRDTRRMCGLRTAAHRSRA